MAKGGKIQVDIDLTGRKRFETEIKRASTKASSSFKKLGKSIKGAAMKIGTIPGLLAAAGLTMFIKSSIDAFKQQEMAVRGVQVAIEQQGGSWALLGRKVQDIAADLQKVTTFGDEQTMAAMATAMNAGMDYAEVLKNISLFQDMASATGRDLRTVSEVLARAYGGETSMLTRYAPIVAK